MSRHTPLDQEHLPELADRLPVPTYDRDDVQTGIAHIGVGNFHRAHQAYYADELLADVGTSEWGICGIGLREADEPMQRVLEEQDGLYTLITKHPDGQTESRVIGAITDYLLGPEHPERVIAKLANADTRIVSLTITEGGYNVVENTGAFDFDNPDVQHELEHPDDPRTVYGYLTAGLRRRRNEGVPAFTIMSCDNIQHNGDLIRDMLLAFAERQDPDLAAWIESEVCFPNSMVDRITPVTSEEDIEYVKETHDVKDDWPVPCEPFIQWIVEDAFANGRPPLEEVGVQFVDDVTPYEKMKLRLLNAGHSVVGLLGAVHGYETIDECMADPVFASYLEAFLDIEAIPVLDEVEGIDLNEYKESLLSRFGNRQIRDGVSRICSQSSDKLPKFLLPTVQDNLGSGGSIAYATLVVATWCYYSDKQVDKNGEAIEIIDSMSEELHRAASGTQEDALSFLRMNAVFGNLAQEERFAEIYTDMVQAVYDAPDIRDCMSGLIEDAPA
jgi:mannitol 2-dehydrogenase